MLTLIKGKKFLWEHLKEGKITTSKFILLSCDFLFMCHCVFLPTRLCVQAISHPPPLPWETVFSKDGCKCFSHPTCSATWPCHTPWGREGRRSYVPSPLISVSLWCFWPIKYVGSDAMGLPQRGHKRQGSFHLVLLQHLFSWNAPSCDTPWNLHVDTPVDSPSRVSLQVIPD